MKIFISFLLLWFISITSVSAAPVTIYKFDSKEKEAIFYKLSDELRCLVCQNQNIAESNSELAQDLRRQIYTMLQAGDSEDKIIQFMVDRYGDYVLFNPPFKPLTWLLWLGPAIVLLIASILVLRFIKTQSKDHLKAETYNTEDLERLKQMKSEINRATDREL